MCSAYGVVCGIDGETYSSECVAWAAGGVLADYDGPCRTSAPLTGQCENKISLVVSLIRHNFAFDSFKARLHDVFGY